MADTQNGSAHERIGVYICHCGSNIAGTVDVVEVARWAAQALKGVVVAREYKFLCSTPGQAMIADDIRNEGLTRVVVAACSPHLHEKTFRRVCSNAGLNPYFLQIANIREHVSWVTRDKIAATTKVKTLIAGAVARVQHHRALEPMSVAVNPHTLVLGGGIAGIQAALELGDAGYPVYLVEREPSIGGHMAQYDKTFPTLDCAACILTPRMSEVGQHDKIKLLTYSELESVSGSVGNFKVQIRRKARCVIEDKCTGCGLCIEKCPKKVVDDVFEAGMGYRKAIYSPFPQAVPRIPVIDRKACTWFEKGKCGVCQKLCPTQAVDYEQKDEILEVEVGNIIVATGWDLFDCRRMPQYGYGRFPNVFTSLEFERMCNAAGPTGGRIVLRDGITEPKSVCIVHCVGSRDARYNPYCSSICCMLSLKLGHLVMEKTGAKVYACYIDMRPNKKDYEEFYQRLLDEGMLFVRGKVAEVTDMARLPGEEGKLVVQVEDTLLTKQRRIPVDMVVLMGAIEPRRDARETGLKMGISCGLSGWFIERHAKLDPVATMTEGVFIAGACHGPKDIPDSVSQGAAAAARVQGMISKGTVSIEPVVAAIQEEKCSGCRICNNLCPFNAIEFVADKKVSKINPVLCKGCGTCVAACPANAIAAAHFGNDQVAAEIEGLLWDTPNGEGESPPSEKPEPAPVTT
jgi:heterodisulfide reductase subunit A